MKVCRAMMIVCRLMLILTVLLTAYIVIVALTLMADQAPAALVAVAIVALFLAARRGYSLFACGTARWANGEDLRRAGMLDANTGLILGRIPDSRRKFPAAARALFDPCMESSVACRDFLAKLQKRKEPLVRLSGKAVHTAIFAPTSVGKGVSFVIPHLRTCPDSTVVVDFKGENARLTAKHRREVFGHRVVILDPFKVVTQQPDSFNPLDYIDADSPLAIDECRDLADALVVRTLHERADPHWAAAAELWIAAMAAVVVAYAEPPDRSLQTVRTLLTSPKKMEAAIKLMCDSDAWAGMLSRFGHQLTQFKDKELGSTLTSTNRFLRFLDTLAVQDSTKKSSFDPSVLRKGRMTVYLVLPPEHMRAQSPLLRMWITSMMRAVVRGGLQERNLVHFVLDEAASLGHMDVLEDAVDKFRAYGVRLQFYFQSMGQLRKCFPEGQDQTLLSNTSQVFFGVNDQATAEYVSSRLGEETIFVGSGATSKSTSRQTSREGGPGTVSSSWNSNDNWQQQARRLLKPDEVMTLPERIAITFTPGIPPLWTKLVRYYEERSLGREHGWFRQMCFATAAVMYVAILLLMAVAVAARLTEVANGRRNLVVPYGLPNGSATWHWIRKGR